MTDNLPMLTPDAARGARTLARCHARLEAHRHELEAQAARANQRAATAERLILAGASLAYLVAMAGNVLRIVSFR